MKTALSLPPPSCVAQPSRAHRGSATAILDAAAFDSQLRGPPTAAAAPAVA